MKAKDLILRDWDLGHNSDELAEALFDEDITSRTQLCGIIDAQDPHRLYELVKRTLKEGILFALELGGREYTKADRMTPHEAETTWWAHPAETTRKATQWWHDAGKSWGELLALEPPT